MHCVLAIGKSAIFPDSDMNGFGFQTFGYFAQQLLGNVRQQGVGQDVIDVAGAALDFGAARGYVVDQGSS